MERELLYSSLGQIFLIINQKTFFGSSWTIIIYYNWQSVPNTFRSELSITYETNWNDSLYLGTIWHFVKVSCLKDEAEGSLAITVCLWDCLNSSHHVRNDKKLFKLLDWPRKTHLDILGLKASVLTIDFSGIRWDLCCWTGSWSHWQHPKK